MKNIVPEKSQESAAPVFLAWLAGACFGIVVGVVGWLITSDWGWFYAVPVLAILFECGKSYRPTIIR